MKTGRQNRLFLPLFLALAAALTLGCASTRYGFAPVSAPGEKIEAGERGATFPVAVGGAKGSLRAMSMGIVSLEGGKPQAARALHLCLVVEHPVGDGDWRIDTRKLKLQLPGHGQSGPAYVNSDSPGAPDLVVPAGARRHIDLFYPLPWDEDRVKQIAGFEVHWVIATGGGQASGEITFTRLPVSGRRREIIRVNEPLQHQNQVYDMEEMSPHVWWYDPLYPGNAFPALP
jgi:hypothetical protein